MDAGPKRPLRLLQVLGYAGVAGQRYGITGVERVVQLLLSGLSVERFEHFLVYPAIGHLLHCYRERAQGILAREPQHRFDPGYVNALAQYIRQHEIDMVLSHGLRYDFLSSLACRRAAVPHVVRRPVALADEPMSRLRKSLYALPDAWTLRKCKAIIACSETSKERMLRTQHISARKVTIIPNGVRQPRVNESSCREARRALRVSDRTVLIGGVGQLIPRKAFGSLVEAMGIVQAERTEKMTCVLLGEGPEREALARLAHERGVELLMPGYFPDPYPFIAALDVAVLPSTAEGMPHVVLESMALGVPTVATAVAGTPEVIEDGKSGLLVPPGDVPALAVALDRLVVNADLRHQLGEAGAQRVASHFSLEAMMQGFDRFLTRIARRS